MGEEMVVRLWMKSESLSRFLWEFHTFCFSWRFKRLKKVIYLFGFFVRWWWRLGVCEWECVWCREERDRDRKREREKEREKKRPRECCVALATKTTNKSKRTGQKRKGWYHTHAEKRKTLTKHLYISPMQPFWHQNTRWDNLSTILNGNLANTWLLQLHLKPGLTLNSCAILITFTPCVLGRQVVTISSPAFILDLVYSDTKRYNAWELCSFIVKRLKLALALRVAFAADFVFAGD